VKRLQWTQWMRPMLLENMMIWGRGMVLFGNTAVAAQMKISKASWTRSTLCDIQMNTASRNELPRQVSIFQNAKVVPFETHRHHTVTNCHSVRVHCSFHRGDLPEQMEPKLNHPDFTYYTRMKGSKLRWRQGKDGAKYTTRCRAQCNCGTAMPAAAEAAHNWPIKYVMKYTLLSNNKRHKNVFGKISIIIIFG
jgi:hypothetical protein